MKSTNSVRAHCNKCRATTVHIGGSLIGACKKCGLLNALEIPSIKKMLISVREFNSEPTRLVVSYAVQDIGLFEQLRPSQSRPEPSDVLQALRQSVLKNVGDWYAAYDFYYTTHAYLSIPKSALAPNQQSSLRSKVSVLTGEVMFRLEAIHTFFFELLLLFDELPIHTSEKSDGLRKTIERIITVVEAKTVPELCFNADWYLMAGIALNWYAERISIRPTYQLDKAINSLRSQNAYYLPKAQRKAIIDEITSAFQEELR